MSVPVGRRKQSRFEAEHQLFKLRDEVTALVMNQFGFSKEKHLKNIERYRETHKASGNIDEVTERWKAKTEVFYSVFIPEERKAVLDILRKISSEFTFANSIYPSETPAKIAEFCERRKHMDAAISNCYVLKQELNYIIRTLPVDLNKFTRFAELIDKQVALFKGVKQADNRLIKPRKPKDK